MRLQQIKIIDSLYSLYKAWPRFYDSIIQLISVGQWEKWQNRVFDDLEGKRILEIGVGPGKLLLRIAKKGFEVTGVELKREMAYEARRKIKKAGFEIDILKQSIYHLPFKDGEFDCIIMTFILAEISNLDQAIEELKRVLKKTGKIIIIAGGLPDDNNIFAKILFRLIEPHTSLKLERNNKEYFLKHNFKVQKKDFGPFNMLSKIIAVKL